VPVKETAESRLLGSKDPAFVAFLPPVATALTGWSKLKKLVASSASGDGMCWFTVWGCFTQMHAPSVIEIGIRASVLRKVRVRDLAAMIRSGFRPNEPSRYLVSPILPDMPSCLVRLEPIGPFAPWEVDADDYTVEGVGSINKEVLNLVRTGPAGSARFVVTIPEEKRRQARRKKRHPSDPWKKASRKKKKKKRKVRNVRVNGFEEGKEGKEDAHGSP